LVFNGNGSIYKFIKLRKKHELVLHNRIKEIRAEKKISQAELAKMVGVSRNNISSIETGQFAPTAIICIALDKKIEELFYF